MTLRHHVQIVLVLLRGLLLDAIDDTPCIRWTVARHTTSSTAGTPPRCAGRGWGIHALNCWGHAGVLRQLGRRRVRRRLMRFTRARFGVIDVFPSAGG